jgi:hypothetical protein
MRVFLYRYGAECMRSRGFWCEGAAACFEPLPLGSNKGNRGHGGAEHALCELGQGVELALGRRIEEGNLRQRFLAERLALAVRHVPYTLPSGTPERMVQLG